MKEVTLEELEKVRDEFRGFVDYHILEAAKYLNDMRILDENIKEMKNDG